MTQRTCTVCKLQKDSSEYYKRKTYFNSECKECTKSKARIYRAENKGVAKDYCERNKVHIAEYKKKYLEEHKTEIYAYNKVYIANRLKTDHVFRAIHYYRSRMRKILERGKASVESMQLLGCSAEHLQRWLDFNINILGIQPQDIGPEYHCDHVKPCASFDMSQHRYVKRCFNWKNLQWLPAKNNREKSDKILQRQFLFQELRLRLFEKQEKQSDLYEVEAFRNYPWRVISIVEPQGNLVKENK